MAKQMQPMNIPMNAKLSLAEVDDLIHTADPEKSSFAEKNSITYQGIIRNAHITKDEGYLTTNGKRLTKSQLTDASGKKIGSILTDELGKQYKVPHEWLLRDSYPLKNYTGGEVEAATIYKDNIFILYDDQGLWALVVVDKATKELKKVYQLNEETTGGCIAATIGSTYDTNDAPTLWILSKQTPAGGNLYDNEVRAYYLNSDFEATKLIHTYKGEPLGHKMTACDIKDINRTVGFEDIDQERRGFFRIWKRAPKEWKFYPYYGTVAPNGKVTGEPLLVATKAKVPAPAGGIDPNEFFPIEKKRLNNGTLAWNIKKLYGKDEAEGSCANKGYYLEMLLGYGSRNEPLISSYTRSINTTYDVMISANMSVNDVADKSAGYPDDDPRSFPTDWFISNFADSKGVYYDWGQAWARSYCRASNFVRWESEYLAISTIATEGVRNEELMARDSTNSVPAYPGHWQYTPEHLNERIYTVGGDNKGENSILGNIPFTADVLEWSGSNEGLLTTQIFGLVETSYAFKQTLLTTPSEGGNDSDGETNIVVNAKTGEYLNLYSNGEMYEVVKSSDVNDFWLQKVADYSFKLNVLDNKNLVKEDRDGNISLTRAFIPYNMECILDVNRLKLAPPPAPRMDDWESIVKPPLPGEEPAEGFDRAKWDKTIEELYSKMAKDPNDAWFEGIGHNVNLDVNDPSMSFLLPKIHLPLWIDEKDWNTFKNEAIDRRNSILLPILNNAFLDGEKVDTYYTLQKDSQDCTYKTTQIYMTGPEAVAPKWNIHGKATYDVLKKGMSWWMEEANTVIFPLGLGSTIAGVNFITPSAQLPQGYASRLYTNNNRLFMGFNYTAQIWHGATIFTIYGSNYYYDGQGIYFVGADQDFTNNNFVTYALGMKFLANSGSEAYFYSDFEKRLYVFTGSNTLQPADLLSNVEGTIVDAAFSSKEQALYMLTTEGRILVRTGTDLCQIPNMGSKGHLEGTTEGAAMIDGYSYKIFSPWKGEKVIPFALRTEHFGSTDFVSKLAYVDILVYKNEDEEPAITISSQTLNGIEKNSEKVSIKIKKGDWRGSTYKIRYTPHLNIGNAFDIGVYSMDKIGVQNICFYLEPVSNGMGDPWQNNIISETRSIGLNPTEGTTNTQPSISVF